MKKVLLLVIISFSSIFFLKADNSYADSLRNRMAETTGKEYFNTIVYLFDHYMFTNADSALRYVDLCQKHAEEIGHTIGQCVFMTSRAEVYYNLHLWDSLVVYAPKIIPYFIENEHYDGVFNVYHMWTNVLLSQGKNDEAFEQAQNMYQEALKHDNYKYLSSSCLTLSELYFKTNHLDETSFFINEGFKYMEKWLKQELSIREYLSLVNRAAHFIETASYIGDYNTALEQADIFIEVIKKIHSENNINEGGMELNLFAFFDSFYGFLLTTKAIAYTKFEEYENAKVCLDEAKQYFLKEGAGNYHTLYYQASIDYYMGVNDYKHALYYIDLMLETSLDETDLRNYNNINLMKADALLKIGEYQQSAILFDKSLKIQDSINTVEFNEQLSDLRIKYETAEKENKILEQQISLQKTRQILLVVAILLAASILVAILVWRYNRRITEKNKKLVAHIAQLAKQEKEIGVLKEATEEADKSDEAILFSKLEQLMQEKMLFLNPDISREEIAKELNTNDFYLRAAIKAATELSFGAYIHRLQLEYAKDLLVSNNSNSRAVKDIAYSSGFNSLTTFNRLFKEVYGLSAGEFRRISVKFKD
ncbi:helix-turn-helix transcriptional regulator [Bacteroidales bacterium OttesenSCG-928-K22]|nr:helix-turn-helix transcriptional regulator [Bacteroidales bacterium OttesenSCG-928-K22]